MDESLELPFVEAGLGRIRLLGLFRPEEQYGLEVQWHCAESGWSGW